MRKRIRLQSVGNEYGELSNFAEISNSASSEDVADDPRVVLLPTGDALLVEHTENDDYCGDGGDGSGRNELGRLPMASRNVSGERSATSPLAPPKILGRRSSNSILVDILRR
jgi:predicted NAD-dependent protein-ADP-ribosyltransferase YbiA (DUF1768 family)